MRAEDAEHGLAQPTNPAFLIAVVRPLVPSDMAVTPGLQKDINRAIIYVPGSSHTYIQ